MVRTGSRLPVTANSFGAASSHPCRHVPSHQARNSHQHGLHTRRHHTRSPVLAIQATAYVPFSPMRATPPDVRPPYEHHASTSLRIQRKSSLPVLVCSCAHRNSSLPALLRAFTWARQFTDMGRRHEGDWVCAMRK